MIKIERIRIIKFRGILDLTIEIGCKNFAVCGPNGTGKSGVVDAIEFAISGDISRLSGKGRGSVSVKKHAPHVDFRSRPNDAIVCLEGVIEKTGKTFSITRSVGDPKNAKIEPNTNTVVETLRELACNKTPTLSRRELIQYVLSTPGDRAEEIQALLQLNFLRETQKTLQKISNGCERVRETLQGERSGAVNSLATALGIPDLKPKDLLENVNKRRATLGLPEISKLEANTSIKDGLSVASATTKAGLSKLIAAADVKSLDDLLDEFTAKASQDTTIQIVDRLQVLKGGGDFEVGVDKQELLTRALNLLDEDQCPVCDTLWKPGELTNLINAKLKSLEGILLEKNAIEKLLRPLADQVSTLRKAIADVTRVETSLDPKVDIEELQGFSTLLSDVVIEVRQFKTIDRLLPMLEELHIVKKTFTDQLKCIRDRVASLPDTTDSDAARDYLVEVDVRLQAYREIRRKEQKAESEAETAKTVFDTFKRTYSDGMTKIYGDIQTVFAELYCEINKEDESGFEAFLPVENSGVGLDVDFYGRGKFPPGAYHSEGHQDGMGLCLYLSLMNHLYGEDFRFCVLDDVLMSVDSGHRRAVCAMLINRFPNTQFLFTTHDEVWLRNMQSTGLVKAGNQVHFRNWSVEGGPSEWIPEDVWVEINDLIEKNDILAASAKLRHYFEYLSGELCHELGASVTFRGDHRYALGQLLPNATSKLAKLFKLGKSAAVSWKNKELGDGIAEKEGEFKKIVATTKLEEWGVNATVHYNTWAVLTKEDFQPIANAFRSLDKAVRCEKCKSLLFLRPHIGTEETLRCACSDVHINLKKNKS